VVEVIFHIQFVYFFDNKILNQIDKRKTNLLFPEFEIEKTIVNNEKHFLILLSLIDHQEVTLLKIENQTTNFKKQFTVMYGGLR